MSPRTAWRERVCQHVAVHSLDVRQTHRRIHLGKSLKAFEQLVLLLVVPGGNHYYHKVVGAEVLVYLFFRYLGGVLGVGRKRGITVNVVGLVGQDKSCDQQDREKRRNHEAGLDVELADCGYVRNEVAVMSLVDERRRRTSADQASA